jgi:ABC-2 type transport system permease protein
MSAAATRPSVRSDDGFITAHPTPSWVTPLRAVLRRGLLDQRRAILTWGGPLGAMCALITLIFPSIQGSLDELVKNYPPALEEAFGVQGMTSVQGYLHGEMFSIIVPFAIAIFAIRAVSRMTVVAEERHELDTVLALPLPRRTLCWGGLLVTLGVSLAILAVAGVLALLGSVVAGAGLSAGHVAAGVVGVWPLAVFFAGVALVVGGWRSGAGLATGASTGLLVLMYVLNVAGTATDALEPLRWLSVFTLYGAPLRDGLDVASFAALTLMGLVLAALGIVLFGRRDLHG